MSDQRPRVFRLKFHGKRPDGGFYRRVDVMAPDLESAIVAVREMYAGQDGLCLEFVAGKCIAVIESVAAAEVSA